MKPAVCCICGKSALNDSPNLCGDWVEFKNYLEQDSASLSHPVGLEYFCSEHLSAAHDLASIDSDEALDKLKLIFPYMDSNINYGFHKVSWWKRLLNK
jgi:hypothetical protein